VNHARSRVAAALLAPIMALGCADNDPSGPTPSTATTPTVLAAQTTPSTTAPTPAPPAAAGEDRFVKMSKHAEARGLAEPFRGITTGGKIVPGLFPVRSTGVSTEPVRKAADVFLASLTTDQRARTQFKVEDPEWRKWMNQHFYVRQGVSFGELSTPQRVAALRLLVAALSAKGMMLTRDVMRLNETLAEMKNNWQEYGEGRYWLTVMGEPSETEPWGFQLDGHHLIINSYVLGDQVVMTPSFWGSEPVVARSGRYEGTAILRQEQDKGLAFVNALPDEQKNKAILEVSKRGNNNVGEAFKDNVVLAFAGVRAADLSDDHKGQLLELIGLYVNNMDEGQAKMRWTRSAGISTTPGSPGSAGRIPTPCSTTGSTARSS
jgi:hypothetical protein